MELKIDTVQNDMDSVTTYYLKLFDQYTNRDVWGITDSNVKNDVNTSYLGWKDESDIDSVNPNLTLPEDESEDTEEEEEEEDTDEKVEDSDEMDEMEEEEDEDEDEDEDEEDEGDVGVPNQGILEVNFAISETLVFQVKDVQDAIQQLRSILLVYDLILPPVTIFGETPREIYDIELFDKNFERFWLLHLDIIRVSDTYQVYAGVVAA